MVHAETMVLASGGAGTLSSNTSLELISGGDSVKFNPAGDIVFGDDYDALRPTTDTLVDLGEPTKTFRYFVPRTIVATRPAAAAGVAGLLWCSREGAGQKEKVWICMQNDANGYEWVQLGITT